MVRQNLTAAESRFSKNAKTLDTVGAGSRSLFFWLSRTLEKIPFRNIYNPNAIQFQIVQDEWEKQELESLRFADLIKHLGRKLETEIIIEY